MEMPRRCPRLTNEDIQPAESRVQFRVKFKLTGLTLTNLEDAVEQTDALSGRGE